ncbi:MAG: hypothetical protein [Enterobacteria phage RP5]|nr:MAG: hypothetical protein [Enterobacteria phage RP5]
MPSSFLAGLPVINKVCFISAIPYIIDKFTADRL